jgi:hypothetical protein
MILISHRGNLKGPDPQKENSPSYIITALSKGYDVEIDVWFVESKLYLGHDKPQYQIELQFLQNPKLWCHCKNINALEYLIDHKIRCFFHMTDDVTLTSDGYLWTFPGKKLTKKSICVMPEVYPNQEYNFAAGVCSDFIDDLERIKK